MGLAILLSTPKDMSSVAAPEGLRPRTTMGPKRLIWMMLFVANPLEVGLSFSLLWATAG